MKKKIDKILTLHPEEGKKGVNIALAKYEILKDYILTVMKEEGKIGAMALYDKSTNDLGASFDGKVAWYCVTVKLDLEARGLIERIPKSKPQMLQLSK